MHVLWLIFSVIFFYCIILLGYCIRIMLASYNGLEKAMAPHSSTLAWKIPWMEEPGRLQSMRSLRVEHDWATELKLNWTEVTVGRSLCSITISKDWIKRTKVWILLLCKLFQLPALRAVIYGLFCFWGRDSSMCIFTLWWGLHL